MAIIEDIMNEDEEDNSMDDEEDEEDDIMEDEVRFVQESFIQELFQMAGEKRKDLYRIDVTHYNRAKLTYLKLKQGLTCMSKTSESAQAEADFPGSTTGSTPSSETIEVAQAPAGLPNSSADTICLGGAQPSAELNAFIKNLRVAEINNDVLSFPEDTCIGGDAKLKFLAGRLFVRECYQLLSDLTMLLSCRMKKFCLSGATGMGKSFFSYYMLHKLMGMKKTIVWKPASADIVVCITLTATQFARNVDAFEAQLNDPSTWYIVDGSLPEEFPAITLFVISFDQKIATPFEERGASTFYVPVWSPEEVKKAHAAGVARAQDGNPELQWSEVENLLQKWAGVPRFIFQFAHNQAERDSFEMTVDEHSFTNILSRISEMPHLNWDWLLAVLKCS